MVISEGRCTLKLQVVSFTGYLTVIEYHDREGEFHKIGNSLE